MNPRPKAVIVSAVRTPTGSFNGVFRSIPATKLGGIAIDAALKRIDLPVTLSTRSSWAAFLRLVSVGSTSHRCSAKLDHNMVDTNLLA